MHGRARLSSQRGAVSSRAARALLLLCLATAAGVSGCARAVPVQAAPSATEVDCAEVMVRLPDVLGDRQRQETTGQSTAAWGRPQDQVTLRCGADPLPPTTDPCVSVDGVDWVLRRPGASDGATTYTSYGREPSVELTFEGENPFGTDLVLADLSAAVAFLPSSRSCT